MTSLVVGWLVVTRVHCGQTVHHRHSYYGTLIGNPTPGIQRYNFRPPGVTPNRGMGAVRRFLSNYFDLLFIMTLLGALVVLLHLRRRNLDFLDYNKIYNMT